MRTSSAAFTRQPRCAFFFFPKERLPMDELMCELVNRLNAELREEFEERAGIVEFEAGLTRDESECFALMDVLHRYPWALAGVTVIQFQLGTDTCFLVTTEKDGLQRVARFGGDGSHFVDLAEVVRERFQGAALLSKWPAPVE